MIPALRGAARSLAHRPAYTALSVGLLALGVAAVTAVFAVADVALLRALPYRDSSRLVWLSAREPVTGDSSTVSGLVPLQLVRWRSETQALEGVEGAIPKSIIAAGAGEPEVLPGMLVSAGLFGVIGTPPADGRGFTRDEEFAASPVAVVSHEFAVRRLGGAANLVGRSITLDDVPRTIVGVMPPGYSVLFTPADVWIPLPLDAPQMASKVRSILAVGRLKPGTSLPQAVDDLNRSNDGIAREVPQFRHTRAGVEPLRDFLFGSDRAPLLVMCGAVALLILIATANVLNLALSDALSRRHATMTRLALGAGRSHLVAVRGAETVVIIAVAGVLGLALGRGALLAVRSVDARLFAGFGDLRLGLRVTVVAAAASLITGAVSALPAIMGELRLGVAGLAGAWARTVGSRRDRRLREALLAAQVGLALVLLLAASLLARNLRSLTRSPQGFDSAGLLAVKFPMPARYTTPTERAGYVERLVGAVGALPGVRSASASQVQFSLGSSSLSFYAIEGVAHEDSTGFVAAIRHVMPDVFTVMRARVIEGRGIDATDREGSRPVAVVSKSFARTYLGGRAVGARIRRTASSTFQWMDVVGVADDIKDAGTGVDVGPAVYVPYLQENQPIVTMTLLLRVRDGGVRLDQPVRQAIASVDPAQAISRIVTVAQLQAESSAQPRFEALVVGLFGTTALLLVIGGIYALTLFTVLQRTREIGVRAALGATPRWLVAESVRSSMRPVLAGMIAGLVAAAPALAVMQRQLHESLAANDLPLLGVVLLAMVVASAVAAAIPGRRAAAVSPVEAMRA